MSLPKVGKKNMIIEESKSTKIFPKSIILNKIQFVQSQVLIKKSLHSTY